MWPTDLLRLGATCWRSLGSGRELRLGLSGEVTLEQDSLPQPVPELLAYEPVGRFNLLGFKLEFRLGLSGEVTLEQDSLPQPVPELLAYEPVGRFNLLGFK